MVCSNFLLSATDMNKRENNEVLNMRAGKKKGGLWMRLAILQPCWDKKHVSLTPFRWHRQWRA
jgi:hypothetical protein